MSHKVKTGIFLVSFLTKIYNLSCEQRFEYSPVIF